MGRGSSKVSGGGGGSVAFNDFPEAFAPGKDFQAVGGVNHAARTVSRMTQAEWDQYSASMRSGMTAAEEKTIMRQFSSTPNGDGDYVIGYVQTRNSFYINKVLYDPANDGKTVNQMFSRAADRKTVKTMDKLINNHSTPADASYTRFCGADAIKATFNFSDSDMQLISNAANLTPGELKKLNKALTGSASLNKSYTSTSANRTLNAFSRYPFERKISVPKGTKAFSPNNAQESEVIFGRGIKTKLSGISISSDGHIVLHETFDGYQ